MLLSSVSTSAIYFPDLGTTNRLWEQFSYYINFVDEESHPPDDAFTICQPIMIAPLSALELYRSFVKDIYILPSEYYPVTTLFILQCLFFQPHL